MEHVFVKLNRARCLPSTAGKPSHPTALRNAMLRKRKAQQPSRSSYWELLGTKHNKWKFGLGPRVGVGKVGAPCPFLGEWRALTKAGGKAGAKVRANTFRLSQSPPHPSARIWTRPQPVHLHHFNVFRLIWFILHDCKETTVQSEPVFERKLALEAGAFAGLDFIGWGFWRGFNISTVGSEDLSLYCSLLNLLKWKCKQGFHKLTPAPKNLIHSLVTEYKQMQVVHDQWPMDLCHLRICDLNFSSAIKANDMGRPCYWR